MEDVNETTLRAAVRDAKRIVVKVGSSSLTGPGGHERLREVARSLQDSTRQGKQVVLVSSGAVAAGVDALGWAERPWDLARLQAAASIGQGILLHRYQEAYQSAGMLVGQVLLTSADVADRARHQNVRRTLEALLQSGATPVVNENDTVATDELRFGDNDRLAALVAHLLQADALVLLSDVDGLWTKPPSVPGAEPINFVGGPEDLHGLQVGDSTSNVGTGGMLTKVTAAEIASRGGIPTIVGNARSIQSALRGESGTVFAPRKDRLSARELWILHAAEPQGGVWIDDGAHQAIQGGASLLVPGVVTTAGSFQEGDVVLVHHGNEVQWHGVARIASTDLHANPGRGRILVHRDDLVKV